MKPWKLTDDFRKELVLSTFSAFAHHITRRKKASSSSPKPPGDE
jgi:hypothetical protein